MKKHIQYLLFIPLIYIIPSCVPTEEEKNKKHEEEKAEVQVSSNFTEIEDAFHFYTLGDWGRNGHHKQKELATMMDKAGHVIEPEFIVSTGDNFYPNGVASTADPYWKSSFEDIYSGASLFCPWYVILGNHDYRGSYQAEIDYTNVSQRWNMPSQYYHKDVVTDDGATVRFVFIDTTPLNDEYYEETKYAEVHNQDTTAQLVWIDKMLDVKVDWKIVVGHHPLYSGGKRKEDKLWVKTHLEELFTKHNVQLYLAGHEHDLQHIKNDDLPTHHIISGAGSEVRPTGMMEHSIFAESVQGFVTSAITKDSIYNQYMDYKGEIIYSHSIKK